MVAAPGSTMMEWAQDDTMMERIEGWCGGGVRVDFLLCCGASLFACWVDYFATEVELVLRGAVFRVHSTLGGSRGRWTMAGGPASLFTPNEVILPMGR
jgi:hypothetical protein